MRGKTWLRIGTLLLAVLLPLSLAGGDAQHVLVDLGTLGGSSSLALAVNHQGQVCGGSYTVGDLESHAFLWTATGGMIDLGTLGGSSSGAVAVNDRGEVV